ncbi:unnamed protein product [Rotaria sp. Silwood2]|nr:unnamed protein product [Rotaria sp. Silwood2]
MLTRQGAARIIETEFHRLADIDVDFPDTTSLKPIFYRSIEFIMAEKTVATLLSKTLEQTPKYFAEFLHTYFSPTLEQLASHRLRTRQQLYDEPVIEYYTDVMKLRKIIDPQMTDVSKIDHLYHGFKLSLMKEVFRRAPSTPSQFLEQARQEETLGCLIPTCIYQPSDNNIADLNLRNYSYDRSTHLTEPIYFQNSSNIYSPR